MMGPVLQYSRIRYYKANVIKAFGWQRKDSLVEQIGMFRNRLKVFSP